jgi:hypothetical protein
MPLARVSRGRQARKHWNSSGPDSVPVLIADQQLLDLNKNEDIIS